MEAVRAAAAQEAEAAADKHRGEVAALHDRIAAAERRVTDLQSNALSASAEARAKDAQEAAARILEAQTAADERVRSLVDGHARVSACHVESLAPAAACSPQSALRLSGARAHHIASTRPNTPSPSPSPSPPHCALRRRWSGCTRSAVQR